MKQRITVKQLESKVKLLNKLTGNFDTPYIKSEKTGKFVPQAHVFVLGRAYGGSMIAGIEMMQTRHHSVRNWRALPNSV